MFTIQLLGQFEMKVDGERLSLPTRSAESLAAWLLIHPEVAHRREKLAGILWPDSSEGNARNNLRHALWQLRKSIPDNFVATDRMTIRWQAAAPYRLDVAVFLAGAGKEATREELEAAAIAYSGDLLPGFYDEWIGWERERLRALYEECMARLLEKLLAAGSWRETVSWAERWIAQGQTPEPAYRALMAAHARLGDLAAVVSTYERCLLALETELGVSPSAETTALYEQIRDGKFGIENWSDYSQRSAPGFSEIRSNLPAQTTPLVGRSAELRVLAGWLADPQRRLVTILGAGGMGKTRLALAAAEAQIPHFADGVFFVPLAGITDPPAIVPAIATALGLSLQETSRPPRQQLLEALRRRRLLLLLDNFEHLLDATALLVEILEAAPKVRILVTSRERLRLNAETLLYLHGLDIPAPDVDATAAIAHSAVELFAQNAQRVQHNFAAEEGLAAIVNICRLVEGMPLGILLAASWMDILTPAEIAREIGQSLDFLQADLADLNPRHRSLRGVFEQSWQRLADPERSVFAALAVFRSAIPRPAAEAITGASLTTLLTLVNRSLLQKTAMGYFQMHELMRQYAAERLAATPDREREVHARHAAFYAAFMAEAAPALRGANPDQLKAVEVAVENVRAAWQWASAHKETHLLDQMVDWLSEFAELHGRSAEARADFALTAELLADDPSTFSTRIRVLTHLVTMSRLQGEAEFSRQTLQMTLDLLEGQTGQDQSLEFHRAILLYVSGLSLFGSDRQTAHRRYTEALAIFRAYQNPFWIARALLAVGWAVRHTNYQELESVLDECIALCRLRTDLGHLLGAQELLGLAALGQGRLAEAEEHLAEALATAQRISSPRALARARRSFGVLLILSGHFAEGDAYLVRATTGYDEIGDRDGKVFVTTWQAFVRLHQGGYSETAALAGEGIAQARAWNHRGMIANGLLVMGQARLAQNEYAGAEKLLEECVAHYEALQQGHELAIALATLAYAQRRLGNSRGAIATVNRAMQLITAQAFFPRAVALPVLALLLVDRAENELAVEIHALTQTYPYIANSRWFYDVAGKEVEAIAATQPPNARAAAEERGRARELQTTTAELLELLS